MPVTISFFKWFFLGLGGIGGWLIFFLLSFASMIWMMYDSGTRHLPALGWKISVFFTVILIIPAILYRLTTKPQTHLAELVFYLGILSCLLSILLAFGYYVTFQGMTGCPRGIHGCYEILIGQCPECTQMDRSNFAQLAYQPVSTNVHLELVSGNALALVPINSVDFLIGKSHVCNLMVDDTQISNVHVRIRFARGNWFIQDQGSSYGTFVNGKKINATRLNNGDQITLGKTIYTFRM